MSFKYCQAKDTFGIGTIRCRICDGDAMVDGSTCQFYNILFCSFCLQINMSLKHLAVQSDTMFLYAPIQELSGPKKLLHCKDGPICIYLANEQQLLIRSLKEEAYWVYKVGFLSMEDLCAP